MPRRGARVVRSRPEWAFRLLLAFAALVAAVVSIAFSLAQVLAGGDAARAYAFAPYDGRLTALMASSLSAAEATVADRGRSDALARAALRQDPTAVLAVSTLGINAEARSDTAAARRIFAYAGTLSRRDVRTQLWTIEDAVRRGDVPGALRAYDIALRTKPGMADALFPVLAAASAEPVVRSGLFRTLALRPQWGESFLQHLAVNGPDPRSTARLFTGLHRTGVVAPAAQSAVINALIGSGHFDDAWGYYATVRGGADRSYSRDARFAGAKEPARFDWAPVVGSGITTSIQGGIFDFAAPATVGGPLLEQLQVLPPGTYRLSGRSSGIDQVDNAHPYWVLTCQSGRELGRVVLPNSAQAGGRFAGAFSVPAGCPVQMLTLVARPSEAVGGLSGQLDRAQLEPLR